MMNPLKRAFLSLKRRLPKTLLLLLLLVVLGTAMSAIVAIREGMHRVNDDIKGQLGSVITTQFRSDISDDELFNAPALSLETEEAIGASPYVKSTEFVSTNFISSDTLEPFDKNAMQIEPLRLFSTRLALPLYFEDGVANLLQGRGFSDEELQGTTPFIIIHKDLAELNNVKVGDKINFFKLIGNGADKAFSGESVSEEEKVWLQDVEIIGLYTYADREAASSTSPADVFGSEKNHIFINDSAIKRLEEIIYEKEVDLYQRGLLPVEFEPELHHLHMTYWRLYDPSDIRAFVEENTPLLPKEYEFISSLLAYDYLLNPIDQNVNLSNTLLIASIATVLLVATLVIFLFLKDRKKELGIYLSLGEKKRNIRLQILIEVLLITMISLGVSLFLGEIIADQVSQDLVMERLTSSQGEMSDFSDYLQLSASLSMGFTHTSVNSIQESYQIEMTPYYILTFIGLGAITIFLASLIALEFSLRMSPKKVLMD